MILGVSRSSIRVVFAASLGYLVDLFDTFLLPALRVPSLRDLGVTAASSLSVGTDIFNLQLLGQTLGALLVWGPLSDKYGRKKVLFASIMIYGAGSFATAFAHGLTSFAVMRFVAGVGLGGELGAGIALISETMKPEDRTKGTMIVGFFGMLGVVLAGLVAKSPLTWRTDYLVGGALAVLILAFRFGARESNLFEHSVAVDQPSYWSILNYLARPSKLLKLIACVLVGAPTFFVVGLLVSGAPEFGAALGMHIKPNSSDALVWTYSSIAVGGIACGLVAQALKSRKFALIVFHAITLLGFGLILFLPAISPVGYYWRCAVTGLGIGFWANMVTNASEQWGTNVRGTVTIAVPNFVRLLLFPISSVFLVLRPHFGYIAAAAIIGLVCSALAITSTLFLKDGFHRDLAFSENLGPVQQSTQTAESGSPSIPHPQLISLEEEMPEDLEYWNEDNYEQLPESRRKLILAHNALVAKIDRLSLPVGFEYTAELSHTYFNGPGLTLTLNVSGPGPQPYHHDCIMALPRFGDSNPEGESALLCEECKKWLGDLKAFEKRRADAQTRWPSWDEIIAVAPSFDRKNSTNNGTGFTYQESITVNANELG